MISVNGRPITALTDSSKPIGKFIKNNTHGQGLPWPKRSVKFEQAKCDLIGIKKLYDNDSYCRVAVDKYVDLLFKRGWSLDSSNPDAKGYLKKRLSIMKASTGIHFDILLKEVAHSLVLYSNAFVKKSMMKKREAKLFTPVKTGLDNIVVGLFPMHPASIFIHRDKFNNVLKYQQRDISLAKENPRTGMHILPEMPPSGRKNWPQYKPEHVMHIYINREPGYAFGNSTLAAVIDDLQALRMIEEISGRLAHRNTFPLFHAQVGIAQPGMGAGEEEVIMMQEIIGDMSFEGTLVTNERCNIDVYGADGEALDTKPLLDYFEARSFSGLNVSPVQMGRDTSNRATADALTGEMHDRAQSFQRRLAIFAEDLFDHLLREGGFNTTDEKNKVYLLWPEIDLETKVKKDSNTVQLWINNMISASDMRRELGYDPFTDDDMKELFVELVTNNTASLQGELQVKAQSARAAQNNSDNTSNKKAADNKNRPANQHKKRSGPKRKREHFDNKVMKYCDSLTTATVNTIDTALLSIIGIWKELTIAITETENKEHKINHCMDKIYNIISKAQNKTYMMRNRLNEFAISTMDKSLSIAMEYFKKLITQSIYSKHKIDTLYNMLEDIVFESIVSAQILGDIHVNATTSNSKIDCICGSV